MFCLLQAKDFLASYSGRSVTTLSALCVTNLETGRVSEGTHEATVFWKDIPTNVVDAVVARGLIMSSVSIAGLVGSRRNLTTPTCGEQLGGRIKLRVSAASGTAVVPFHFPPRFLTRVRETACARRHTSHCSLCRGGAAAEKETMPSRPRSCHPWL